jgi:hypothetical protein
VPRRRTEPQLIRRAAVLLLLSLVGPSSLHAQDARAHASIEAAARVSALRGSAKLFVGGIGLLDLGGRVSFGGGGWILLGTSRIYAGSADSDRDLRVAYGGVVADVELVRDARWDLRARALLGAGNGKISLRVAGVQLAADNFGVIEPELCGSWHVSPNASVVGSLAYRYTYGVNDLPSVSQDNLAGVSLGVGFAVRSF